MIGSNTVSQLLRVFLRIPVQSSRSGQSKRAGELGRAYGDKHDLRFSSVTTPLNFSDAPASCCNLTGECLSGATLAYPVKRKCRFLVVSWCRCLLADIVMPKGEKRCRPHQLRQSRSR